MTAPLFDLQSHSVHSDGALEPADVIAHAARAGVELVALSDHDTLAGVDEALAAGAELGIEVVAATEITIVDPVRDDLHLLGYRVDHNDAALLDLLARSRADRDGRAQRMADELRALGWALDDSILQAHAAAGLPIGRPHLAKAVLADPANAQRLAGEGLNDVGPVIVKYLIPGAPAFVARTMPAVPDAIAAIHDAGGVAVWAHPFWDLEDPALVDRDRAPLRAGRARRGRGVLCHAQPRADRHARRAVRRARAADDRIGRLPRSRASDLRQLPRLLAARPRARARADRRSEPGGLSHAAPILGGPGDTSEREQHR